MEINQFLDEVASVLKADLSEKDFALFLLKLFGGFNNCEIGRVLKVSESTVRRRFNEIVEGTLVTKTEYIYDGRELIDTRESGSMIRTTAKYRNMRRALMRNAHLHDEL